MRFVGYFYAQASRFVLSALNGTKIHKSNYGRLGDYIFMEWVSQNKKVKMFNKKYEVPIIRILKAKKLETISNVDIEHVMVSVFDNTCTESILMKYNTLTQQESSYICNRACRDCMREFVESVKNTKAKEVKNG